MISKILGGITLALALLVLCAWNFHTTVGMKRTFNASAADVWRVWNDADSIKKWWGSVPGRWSDDITVIVDFSEREGKARVTVTEVGIPLIAYPLMKIGWAQQFDKIQLLLPKN